MVKHRWVVAGLIAVALSWPGKALPQTASPETLAAAKELIIEARLADQIKLAMPMMLRQLKPLIAKGNPLVERDFDALIPVIMSAMNTHLEGFLNSGAQIYARHFTADEMRQVTNFYRTSAGQKFLQKQPELIQESMVLGQQFGQVVAKDVQIRMIEELRKRGHNI